METFRKAPCWWRRIGGYESGKIIQGWKADGGAQSACRRSRIDTTKDGISAAVRVEPHMKTIEVTDEKITIRLAKVTFFLSQAEARSFANFV